MNHVFHRFFMFFCFTVSLGILSIAACGSDDSGTNPANTGGGGATAQGGTAGSQIEAGTGGLPGNGGTAGNGGSTNGWVMGRVGKATKGAIILSKQAGNIQGFTVSSLAKPTNLPGTGGDGGSGGAADAGNAGGAPDTAPKVDLSQITPDFTEMWVPIPPYRTILNQPWAPPRIAIILPDSTSTVLEPFPNYLTEMTLDFFGGVETTVNSTPMRFYSGLSLDMAKCKGRQFWISNVTDTIYEIFSNAPKTVFVSNLPPFSSIICYKGFLLGSALPQYSSDPLIGQPVIGARLIKVTLDAPPVVSTIAAFPVTTDYGVKAVDIMISGSLPFMSEDKRVPVGMRIPIVPMGNDYLFGDVGGKIIYSLEQDGSNVQPLTDAPINMVSMISAPNGVIYAVLAPVIGHFTGQYPVTLQGPMIRAFDGMTWQDVYALPAYSQSVLSSQDLRIPCPSAYADSGLDVCTTPWGIFVKIEYGATPILYIADPINGVMYAIPLDMSDQDAGAGGSGGT